MAFFWALFTRTDRLVSPSRRLSAKTFPPPVEQRYTQEFVDSCFEKNVDPRNFPVSESK